MQGLAEGHEVMNNTTGVPVRRLRFRQSLNRIHRADTPIYTKCLHILIISYI